MPVMWCCLAVWILALKCAAMDLRDMDRAVGELTERVLQKCHITITDACTIARCQETHFRRALKGEGYRNIALIHLIRIGIAHPIFMVHFTADLMWFVVRQRAIDILDTVSVRKGA